MTSTVLLTLLVVGGLVGILSGLLGIGGGVLIVPFLYFFYGHPTWSGTGLGTDLLVTVAHATSLFIIVPTALRGVLRFQQAHLVVWRVALPVAVASIVAAIVGASLAPYIPGAILELAFAVLLVVAAIQMVRGYGVEARGRERHVTWPRAVVTGGVVGLLSALLGVGGGVVAIPLLAHLMRLEVRELAATSLVVVMFSALAGMVTYMVGGAGVAGRPPGSLGYVHLLAALPILAGSLLTVGWGTRLNQRLPVRQLRWIFAILFGAVAVQLLVENLRRVS
jgi:uncharacterized membrane protein YfcA